MLIRPTPNYIKFRVLLNFFRGKAELFNLDLNSIKCEFCTLSRVRCKRAKYTAARLCNSGERAGVTFAPQARQQSKLLRRQKQPLE